MHSIRAKIMRITIAAILTSVLVLLVTVFFTVGRESDRSSAVTMTLMSENVRNTLNDYLDSIEQSVEMAAHYAADTLDSVALVEGGVAGAYAEENGRTLAQEKELDLYLAEHCARVQEAFSSVANHTNGVVSYYYCISPAISENEHGFFCSRMGRTGFEEQEPLDARALDPEDTEHTVWYYLPIQRGRPSWVGPYRAHFLDDVQTVSYLAPIYKAGELIGVLGMDILYDTLVDRIDEIQVYDSGFVSLFDENWQVLYHPELEMGSDPQLPERMADESVLSKESSGGTVLRYEADGEERQMAFTTLSNGMKLVVTAPVSEITASWRQMTRMILIFTALITFVFVVITWIVLGILIRPLQRLTAASRRLADGEYDVELDYQGRNEVGVLTGAFKQMRDHLQRYIGDLNRRIQTDELTGLPNIEHFYELAEESRQRMEKTGEKPAVLFFNLNGMKIYNRQYGLAEGDQLLRAVAAVLAEQFGIENCCRIGQDNFAALCREEEAEEKLEAVFAACRNANGGKSLPVRAGIYPCSLERVNISVACDRAKYACDVYRGSFVSEYCCVDSEMLKSAENYRYVVNNFDRAISERWIKVWFQPIVRAANGRVCDEEALSRWVDPDRGMISPGNFIPVLESTRLIHRLDLYVLDQILLKMQLQAEEGLFVVPQSLNLSRVDFDMLDIVEEIRHRVDRAGIPREKLTIELTESTVGGDFEFIREQVRRFQELGFPVWMDDFGSGYSSLDVLQDIHFDLIKFDMRFMKNFDRGEESRIILTELVRMAMALGIETVAEGVETKEQVEFLREIGCTKLQGFYYCRAIPLEEILERYRTRIQIGYENPEEEAYYAAVGSINLYDLTSVSNDSAMLGNFFDTLPMAIIESDAGTFRTVRSNKSYQVLMKRIFGIEDLEKPRSFASLQAEGEAPLAQAVRRCRTEGMQLFFDRTLDDGSVIHSMARHIAVNPVTGIAACAVAVLGITDKTNRETD